MIGRQRSIGSGAIVDPDGYIITNAHVVAGARQVQVVLHRDTTADGPVRLARARRRARPSTPASSAPRRDIDLALLKVDLTGLPALPLANYDAIRQGELVFAFGSPEGLRNSVSMGVVSSVARQVEPDSPTIYIQTDAPINPGNSGGPLVNIDGELVGLNTFILTESGGSQGLGFAIPSAIVAAAYPQLRKYGHLHHGQIGFAMQTITPALAAGLGLSRTSGVMVSDVLPGSCRRGGRHRRQGRGDGRQRKTGGERADAVARVEPVPGRRDGGAGPPAGKRRRDGARDGDGAAASDRRTGRAGRSGEERHRQARDRRHRRRRRHGGAVAWPAHFIRRLRRREDPGVVRERSAAGRRRRHPRDEQLRREERRRPARADGRRQGQQRSGPPD